MELTPAPYQVARWLRGPPEAIEWVKSKRDYKVVEDRDGRPVVLASSPWLLDYALREVKDLELLEVSPLTDG